jgi:hypothetical protein
MSSILPTTLNIHPPCVLDLVIIRRTQHAASKRKIKTKTPHDVDLPFPRNKRHPHPHTEREKTPKFFPLLGVALSYHFSHITKRKCMLCQKLVKLVKNGRQQVANDQKLLENGRKVIENSWKLVKRDRVLGRKTWSNIVKNWSKIG